MLIDKIIKITTSFYFLLFILFLSVIFIIIFIYWIFLMYYFKFKSRFWYIQPVFHLYDFQYYFYNKGIIMKKLPEKNNYTDFKNIESVFIKSVSTKNIDDCVSLLQKHYFKNKDNKYYPKKENILPYLNNSKSVITFYFLKDNFDETNKKMIGCMTGHPLEVCITKENICFSIYYIDFLCVNKKYRGKQLAEKIIQTHEYTQRFLNKNISVSLFKREDELTGIIPLCIYKTYAFSMEKWCAYDNIIFDIEYKILFVDSQNLYLLNEFIHSQKTKKKYEISIMMDLYDLQELIITKNIYVIMIIKNDEVIYSYFLRKTCTFVTIDTQFISLFASININNNNKDNNKLFIEGFKVSLSRLLIKLNTQKDITYPGSKNSTNSIKLKNNLTYSHLIVEDISDNYLIIDNLKIKTKPELISPTAYFFYNFAHQPFNSKDVLIIS